LKFAAHVRRGTRTNSTTFSDTDLLGWMEVRQDEIARAIVKADEDILLIPQKDDLVANQRVYSFPTDILSSIKRVEAKLDETDYIKLGEFDMTQYSRTILTEADITNNFANLEGEAFFDILRKSIKIYSGTITSVTDGLYIWCNTWPAVITDLTNEIDMSIDPSTTTHGIPRALHEIWARGVIIDYKGSRQKPIPLTEVELNYRVDKAEAIDSLKPANLDREVIGRLPPASERGNDGADY